MRELKEELNKINDKMKGELRKKRKKIEKIEKDINKKEE